MKKFIFVLALMVPALNQGLLPPLYETLAEFKSLINDDRLPQSLQSGEAIISIKKQEDNFIVTTNKSQLVVRIVHEKTQMIGPAKFHLEFDKRQPEH